MAARCPPMSQPAKSVLSHLSIGTNDVARAVRFYDAVLATLDISRVMSHGTSAVGYGHGFPEFWLHAPIDGRPASAGNGTHVCFAARGRGEVDAFHAAALRAGGTDDGPPGLRPEYGARYYACFVRDLDGHKLEALYLEPGG